MKNIGRFPLKINNRLLLPKKTYISSASSRVRFLDYILYVIPESKKPYGKSHSSRRLFLVWISAFFAILIIWSLMIWGISELFSNNKQEIDHSVPIVTSVERREIEIDANVPSSIKVGSNIPITLNISGLVIDDEYPTYLKYEIGNGDIIYQHKLNKDLAKNSLFVTQSNSGIEVRKYITFKEPGLIDISVSTYFFNGLTYGRNDQLLTTLVKTIPEKICTRISETKIDFGDVKLGKKTNRLLLISNECDKEGTVSRIDGQDISYDTNRDFILPPNSNIPIMISFTPSKKGYINEKIKIWTNLQVQPSIINYKANVLQDTVVFAEPNETDPLKINQETIRIEQNKIIIQNGADKIISVANIGEGRIIESTKRVWVLQYLNTSQFPESIELEFKSGKKQKYFLKNNRYQ